MIESKKEFLQKEIMKICRRLNVENHNELLHFPKYFQIETCRICNSRCRFCAIEQWDKSIPFMSDELFEKISVELSSYSDWIEMVAVQRAGEPLMDKKICSRVARLKKAGIKKVSISTNASLLTVEKGKELILSGLDEMMISIDTLDKSEYEYVRRNLSFDTVMSNIENFFLLRDDMNPNLIIRIRGVAYKELEAVEEKCRIRTWEKHWGKFRKAQDRVYLKKAHNWGNQIDLGLNLNNATSGNYGDVFHPCVLPWSSFHITTSGKVALCPQDYDGKMNIGSVLENSIQEIWQGANWNKIRQQHADGERNEILFCRGCKLFDPDFSLEEKD